MTTKTKTKTTKSTALATAEQGATIAFAGKTFAELLAQAEQAGTKLREPDRVDDKDKLVGVPFVIVGVKMKNGDFGPYIQLQVVIPDGRVLLVSDGGAGFAKQLAPVDGQPLKLPIHVPEGLRRSDYTHPEHGPSTTYYLSGGATFDGWENPNATKPKRQRGANGRAMAD